MNNEIRFNGLASHRELLTRVIQRQRGNMTAIGWDLNVSSRNVRRHIIWAGLWPEVERARQAPKLIGSDLLARALEKL